ncbi:MAG: purine-nucleoside phosphorylase [Gemmataceae bacterium]
MLSLADFGRMVQEYRPALFLVLGSGQGQIAQRITQAQRLAFAEIPGLPAAQVPGHKGCLTLGFLGGCAVLVSEGRLHGYEGHPESSIVRTVQLAAQWGVQAVILTNAAGGIRSDLEPGSLLPIRQLLRFQQPVPQVLTPAWIARFGRWPGSYLMLSGPSYETPAEIVALRRYGVDAVGMSTVPEALEAARLGLEVGAISLITNKAAGLAKGVNHHEVLEIARSSGERLGEVLEQAIRLWYAEKR